VPPLSTCDRAVHRIEEAVRPVESMAARPAVWSAAPSHRRLVVTFSPRLRERVRVSQSPERYLHSEDAGAG
jgi:hypothetical protein